MAIEQLREIKINKNEKIQDDFLKKVLYVQNNCIGSESFGDTTEFYDEDGIVLMTVDQSNSNKMVFSFDYGEEVYEFEKNNLCA